MFSRHKVKVSSHINIKTSVNPLISFTNEMDKYIQSTALALLSTALESTCSFGNGSICFGNYAIVCNGTSSVSFQLCHLLVCILKIGVFDNIKAFIMVTMVLVKLFCISFHQVFGHQYKSVPKLQSILIH